MPRGKPRKQTPTAYEIEVIKLVALGLENAQIGKRIYRSADTIKSLLYKLTTWNGCPNRTALVAWAFVNGYLDPDDEELKELRGNQIGKGQEVA